MISKAFVHEEIGVARIWPLCFIHLCADHDDLPQASEILSA